MGVTFADFDEDPLEIEVEEFRELLAEDAGITDRVHAAVSEAEPDRPALADAVVDSLIAGFDLHPDEDPIVDIIDACRLLMPLDAVVAHLRATGREDLAALLADALTAAGKWIHEGGWVVHDAAGREIAFVFSARGCDRTWVRIFDGAL